MNRPKSWTVACLVAVASLVFATPSALAQSPFASGWVVAGTTNQGVTTFGAPVQYAPGVATYELFDNIGRNRWGDYSATTRDPVLPNTFWTIQEWASGVNEWSTQIAQVTVGPANTPVILTSFTGSSINTSGFIPPDTMGAMGPQHFTELINGNYAVYDRLGNLQVRTSLDAFWNASGIVPSGFSFDPRILYDASSGHWFATSLDLGFGGNQPANNVLVAVSNDANPLNGWNGFAYTGDLANGLFADFDTLGINADGVYIGTNDFFGGSYQYNTLTVFDKANVIAGNPFVGAGQFVPISPAVGGFTMQPVVDLDGTGDPEAVLGVLSTTALQRTTFTVAGPSGFTGPAIAVTGYAPPVDAGQPGGAAPIDTGDLRISGNAVLANGEIWITQTVLNAGHDAIRWARIDPNTNMVIQEGLISDPNFDFYFPSVSVGAENSPYDVVIGFSGSSRQDPGVVPEPSSWVLFTLGVLGLARYVRKRQGRRQGGEVA